MKYVYIACPYTNGDRSENIRNCINTAEILTANGIIPFVPLLYHFWDLMKCHGHEFWMSLDLAWIDKCDAVLRLPGESTGADREVVYARNNNIPIYFGIDAVIRWAST